MKKTIFLIAMFMTALFLTWNVYSQENAFDNADKNKDGYISNDEFKDAVYQKFKEYDKNNDGKIDKKEFNTKRSPEAAKEFKLMDKNSDSMVNIKEFYDASIQHRNAFDFNRDEKISKEEYYSNKALPIFRFYF
ncbi:MAG TPA: EF-hand domain-containing protein [Syntrophorhabdaceae bacterium]|nr:EF-hand domain-containing protein [Syntrophorhabdaceae bacterium]